MDKENEVRKILIYGNEFWNFYHKQSNKIKERINWTIKLVQVVDRIISGSNIYRIFCFFDKGKLIVVLNGFQKKTQKTPKKEIERALKLQKRYYDEQKE